MGLTSVPGERLDLDDFKQNNVQLPLGRGFALAIAEPDDP
jgi:hypothetical protein